jgi:hypothetical protein
MMTFGRKNYLLIFLIVTLELLFCNISIAAVKSNFTIHTVAETDTTESITYSFIVKYFPDKLDEIQSYIAEVKYWNPHVADWNKLTKGTNIYLGYPFPADIEDRSHVMSKFTLSGSYNLSAGNLSETVTKYSTTVVSTQNSVLSLGLQARYNLSNWENVISGSVYYSQLQLTTITGGAYYDSTVLRFDPEIGGNIYYQFRWRKISILPYGGIDYEGLNTFNARELPEGAPIVVRKNKLFYVTAGLGKGIEYSHYVFLLRGSVSKTIYTTTSSLVPTDKFAGYKGIVTLSFKDNKSPWIFNLFYKGHLLSGPTDLIINRFGIGMGFSFF